MLFPVFVFVFVLHSLEYLVGTKTIIGIEFYFFIYLMHCMCLCLSVCIVWIVDIDATPTS